jgi:hypothetical protein
VRPTTKAVPILLTLATLTSCGPATRAAKDPGDSSQPVSTGLAALERGDSPTPRTTTPDPNAQPAVSSIEGMAQQSALDLEQALAAAASRDASRSSSTTLSQAAPAPEATPSATPMRISPSGDGVSVGLVSVERNSNTTGGGMEGAAAGPQADAGLGSLGGSAAEQTGEDASLGSVIDETQAELGSLLARRAATSVTPMPDLALAAAIAGSQGRPAPELSSLGPSERAILEAIRSVHAFLATSAAGGDSEGVKAVDAPDALQAAADRAAEGLPLRITDARLCTRVVGFGDYTELSVNAFLAGKAARVVVYTEVDRFATRSGAGGRQTVELSQELDVYHDADGAHCWKRPAQSVSESSRVKRRDFFITNAIELPPTLTVGKYRMKITMRDLAGNSVAETTIPFTVVADAKLAHSAE